MTKILILLKILIYITSLNIRLYMGFVQFNRFFYIYTKLLFARVPHEHTSVTNASSSF